VSPCESRSSSRLNSETPFAKADGVLFWALEKHVLCNRELNPENRHPKAGVSNMLKVSNIALSRAFLADIQTPVEPCV
ncbi:hypothetical protein, partial [Pseudomonas fluorescens]